MNAPLKGGEFTTRPFKFEGKRLAINYSTSATGGIRGEIQDENGKKLEGFGLADSAEIIGDELDRVVTWNKRGAVGEWSGRPVRLRFQVKDADLYSLCFRK